MVQRSTVKNFYRALAASPPGAAAAATAATANLASPLGVAAVEIAAEVGTDAALDSTKMAMGGLVMEPTFAMIGEAGPEMVIPLTGPGAMMSPLVKPKRKRSRSARAADKKLSAAFKEANARYRKKDGSLRSGRTQADIARLAHKLRKKMGTTKGQVRKTARRAFER